MDDKKILQLLWSRCNSAIDALAEKFGKRLYLIAVNILSDHQDAEETVNDTYLALWNAIPPQRPEPLCAYVYRTGRNTALKRLRTRTAQKRNSNYDLSLDELAEILPVNSLEEQVDARALGQAIDAFLSTISTENRIVFVRRYWYGDSIADLAAAMNRTESALSVRLHRIRVQLKNYLNKEGFWI